MPSQFEQQVIANKNAIQTILDQAVTFSELDEIASIEDDDIIAVMKADGSDTLFIKYSDFLSQTSQQSWSPILLGFVTTSSATTTDNEIENHFNSIGVSISNNQLKILQSVIKINSVFYTVRYVFKSNTAGEYGNDSGETLISINDLYLLSKEKFNVNDESLNTIIIDLGDIGSSNIETAVNNKPISEDINLQSNALYVFKCIINSVNNSYLYIGEQPKQLGSGSPNPTTSSDFENLLKQGWYFIENSWVEKIGNTNYNEIEVGDVVYYKDVIHNSSTVTLVGWSYSGGDKTLIENYTKIKKIA